MRFSLNYTSGDDRRSQGWSSYHHRGAYLLALGNVADLLAWASNPVYLWTLPMFPLQWLVLSVDALNRRRKRMCACGRCAPDRSTTPSQRNQVTHLCGAPIVMSTLLNAPEGEKEAVCRTSFNSRPPAAPPPEAVLAAMKEGGI